MKVREHIKILDNPVMLEIQELDGTVLYHGYKGCMGYENVDNNVMEREVKNFRIRCTGKHRRNKEDKAELTELNCGIYNYSDLHIELTYTYILE